MEDNGVGEAEIVENFSNVSEPELRARVVELSETQGRAWQAFKMALKEEYFLEDKGRVTKQSFLKWVKQRNKGLIAPALL